MCSSNWTKFTIHQAAAFSAKMTTHNVVSAPLNLRKMFALAMAGDTFYCASTG
jgi:hypothetical protein